MRDGKLLVNGAAEERQFVVEPLAYEMDPMVIFFWNLKLWWCFIDSFWDLTMWLIVVLCFGCRLCQKDMCL